MHQESAVEFASSMRIHIGLEVRDLQRALGFYALLFDTEPTKRRPGYAKFELEEPRVNLSLNENRGSTHNPSTRPAGLHYGIQVKSSDEVQRLASRLASAGVETRVEEEAACCYALQTKVWARDPDGNPWEIFVVLDNDAVAREPDATCCTPGQPSCCG